MIKIDIEMPVYCYDCPCHNGENGRCQISGSFTADKRPFDCPLTEVRHGKIVKTGRPYPYCSVCDTSLERSYFRYCPYCGAKIDREEE